MGNSKPGTGNSNLPVVPNPNQVLELTRKINEAQSKSVDNEKRIIELEKTVNDKSQWNTTVRGWMGTQVSVRLLTGERVEGTLQALDRYTLLVDGTHLSSLTYSDSSVSATAAVPDDCSGEIIIHKGAIATIRRIL